MEIKVNVGETTLKAVVRFATPPDSVPTWEVGNSSVLAVYPSADGLSATFDVLAPGASSVVVHAAKDTDEILLSGLVTAFAGGTYVGSVEFSTG